MPPDPQRNTRTVWIGLGILLGIAVTVTVVVLLIDLLSSVQLG